MQLLEHGASVRNCGGKADQTPLRMAVTDLNMDAKMVELLVSYGASPFLEAKDGKLTQKQCHKRVLLDFPCIVKQAVIQTHAYSFCLLSSCVYLQHAKNSFGPSQHGKILSGMQ